MPTFREQLRSILSEYDTKRSTLVQSWAVIRSEIIRVFADASIELIGASSHNENGDTSALRWRGEYISFKRDDRLLKIVRTSSVANADEHYDPDVLTGEKIEGEVSGFVRSVLEKPAPIATVFPIRA